jgi:hypothetical protein
MGSPFPVQLVEQTGLGPVTTRLWAGGSNQLSYCSQYGGCEEGRTLDVPGMNRLLYQLSYTAN